jgi:hypothetical protein
MTTAQRYRSRLFPRDLKDTLDWVRLSPPVNIGSHEQRHGAHPLVYTSTATLSTTASTPITPPFPGSIKGVRGNVTGAPAGSNLTFDVLLNTYSIFSGGYATIYDGTTRGPIIYPRNTHWRVDDTLQVQIVTIGAATGPLVVHIMFESDL